eukprot:scaffold10073_cov136-Isochrysis_galbana.AAC.12
MKAARPIFSRGRDRRLRVSCAPVGRHLLPIVRQYHDAFATQRIEAFLALGQMFKDHTALHAHALANGEGRGFLELKAGKPNSGRNGAAARCYSCRGA